MITALLKSIFGGIMWVALIAFLLVILFVSKFMPRKTCKNAKSY